MAPAVSADQAPVPPPSYHRAAATALHLDALALVRRLRLLALCQLALCQLALCQLALCQLAVQLARQQCPPAPTSSRLERRERRPRARNDSVAREAYQHVVAGDSSIAVVCARHIP
jgi:hypothetical protein